MFFPDGLEIKEWTIHATLQKSEVASVRDTFAGVVKLVLEWRGEQERFSLGIMVDWEIFLPRRLLHR
jgi:hypothetical protein